MKAAFVSSVCLGALVGLCEGHGHITYPPSRHGGNYSKAGFCQTGECLWFSQPTTIPGKPTLNNPMARTYNVKVSSGPHDWSRKMPWRAPGTAPVKGSGCGVAGGNVLPIPNGGNAPPGVQQGSDGLLLPETKPTVWKKGQVAEVAWAITANHGGGYSWRLCHKHRNITEECFQQNVLRFAGNVSFLQYSDVIPNREGFLKLPRMELPLVVVSEGTFPPGSQWARNPVPSCSYCDQAKCGTRLPNMTEWFEPHAGGSKDHSKYVGGEEWWKQEQCAQDCAGFSMMACPPGMTQFPEPLPGIGSYLGAFLVNEHADPPSSTGIEGLPYSIVDRIIVPSHIEAGEYLLSWRWDCEQSPQIWQNCADVLITDDDTIHV